MNAPVTTDCLICRKHRGEVIVPGGFIYQSDLIAVSHSQLWGNEKEHYLGHLLIETRRHVAGLADLTEQEAQVIGIYTSRAAKALLQTQGMEHIYTFVIGDGVPHVHIHVIGRYPGAPREFWGAKVDEWPQAPKGNEQEMAEVAGRVRRYLQEYYGVEG